MRPLLSLLSSHPDLSLLPIPAPHRLCSIQEDYKYIQCGVSPQQSSVSTTVKSYRWRVALAPHPKDIIW